MTRRIPKRARNDVHLSAGLGSWPAMCGVTSPPPMDRSRTVRGRYWHVTCSECLERYLAQRPGDKYIAARLYRLRKRAEYWDKVRASMRRTRIMAVCGTHEQFLYWRRSNRIDPGDVHYVRDVWDFRGLQPESTEVAFVGTWWRSPVLIGLWGRDGDWFVLDHFIRPAMGRRVAALERVSR